MSAGRSTEHDHEKQKHEENCKRLSHGNVLSPARQLISFFFSPLWFHITFLLYFEHRENIIQIMLLEKESNHHALK